MKVLFAVPSKNRVDVLRKYTYSWLKLLPDFKIFVEPQDLEKYSEFENIVNIGENNKGLGFVKGFMKDYAIENGYDVVFKIDDDIKCFTDFRKKTTPEETVKLIFSLIEEVSIMFDSKKDLGAISFPYSFEMFTKTKWKKTKRVQTSYICRTEYLDHNIKGISCFEDFAVGIRILTDNKIILRYGLMGIMLGVSVGEGTGGMQDFDRNEQALKEIELLRKIYPPLKFKKVQKN